MRCACRSSRDVILLRRRVRPARRGLSAAARHLAARGAHGRNAAGVPAAVLSAAGHRRSRRARHRCRAAAGDRAGPRRETGRHAQPGHGAGLQSAHLAHHPGAVRGARRRRGGLGDDAIVPGDQPAYARPAGRGLRRSRRRTSQGRRVGVLGRRVRPRPGRALAPWLRAAKAQGSSCRAPRNWCRVCTMDASMSGSRNACWPPNWPPAGLERRLDATPSCRATPSCSGCGRAI